MIPEFLIIVKKIWDNRRLAAAAVLIFLFLVFYIYYLRSSHRIETLIRENEQLQQTIEQQKRAIESIKQDYAKIVEIRDELNQKIVETQKDTEELRKKLYRENEGKKSLEQLATKKTNLIQKLVNRGTEKALKCLELITEDKEC